MTDKYSWHWTAVGEVFQHWHCPSQLENSPDYTDPQNRKPYQGFPAISLPNWNWKGRKSSRLSDCTTDFHPCTGRSNGFPKSGAKSSVQGIMQLMPELWSSEHSSESSLRSAEKHWTVLITSCSSSPNAAWDWQHPEGLKYSALVEEVDINPVPFSKSHECLKDVCFLSF